MKNYKFLGSFKSLSHQTDLEIEITLPNLPDNSNCFASCPYIFCFEITNSHIVLNIYQILKQGANEKGKWFQMTDPTLIDCINYEDTDRYVITTKSNTSRKKLNENIAHTVNTPWDKLFGLEDLQDGWQSRIHIDAVCGAVT